MSRRGARGLVLGAMLAAAAFPPAARAHGASRGMHLHVPAEPAARGTTIAVDVDCAAPVVALTIAFAGKDPQVVVPKVPAKHLTASLVVPDAGATTINVVAEAQTSAGKVVRASAIVKLAPPRGPAGGAAPGSHDRLAPL